MASTEPLTGVSAPDNSDPAYTGGAQIGTAVKGLAAVTLPRYASATARDTAWSNWLAGQPAGTRIPDGATCRLTSDDRLWRYDQTNSLWTWDMAAQGLLGKASYSGTTGLADAPGTIAAFNITGLNIPPRRNIALRLRVAGATTVDASHFSAYGFVMYLNGVGTGQRIHWTNGWGYGLAANFSSTIQVGTALNNVGANVSGSLYAGVTYTLIADTNHGAAVFSVHDEGGY